MPKIEESVLVEKALSFRRGEAELNREDYTEEDWNSIQSYLRLETVIEGYSGAELGESFSCVDAVMAEISQEEAGEELGLSLIHI